MKNMFLQKMYLHFAGQCNDHDEIGIVVPIGAKKKVF